MDDREHRGTDALAELACAEGLLAPVEGDADAQRWMDCDVASFAEHRCDEIVDPTTLDDARRDDLSRRALAPDEDLADPRTDCSWLATFWIVDETERLGTLAIARGSCWRFAPVSSLYVFPTGRGRGTAYLARRGLQGSHRGPAFAASAGHVVGLAGERVPVSVPIRMWACSFVRSIDFVWADLPRHVIWIGDRDACFAIERGGKRVELLRATHEGDRLGWEETDATRSEREVGFSPGRRSPSGSRSLVGRCCDRASYSRMPPVRTSAAPRYSRARSPCSSGSTAVQGSRDGRRGFPACLTTRSRVSSKAAESMTGWATHR